MRIKIISLLIAAIMLLPIAAGSPECYFKRGDVTGEGVFNIADVITIISYLFSAGTQPSCLDSADINDNGKIELNDAVFYLNYLFKNGAIILPPFPLSGIDETPDTLSCRGKTDAVCIEEESCGFGKITKQCSCGGKGITAGYCCFGIAQNEQCVIQAYSKISFNSEIKGTTLETRSDRDLFACVVQKKSSAPYITGCSPFTSKEDKELRLTQGKTDQFSQDSIRMSEKTFISWEEGNSRSIYLCNLEGKKKPEECEGSNMFVASGFNPSLGNFLVWEDKNSILACNPLIDTGDYSCKDGKKILVANKKLDTTEANTEIAAPIIKGEYVLYRDKNSLGKYELYSCKITKATSTITTYTCPSKLIKTGAIDLGDSGDINPAGQVVFAEKDNKGTYTIFYTWSTGIKALASSIPLAQSPQLVTLKDELQQVGTYAVWKEARPGIKNTIHLKRLQPDPLTAPEYIIISKGYGGINGPSLFCEQGVCFIQDKILGNYDSDTDFVNSWIPCDLNSLSRATEEEKRVKIFGGCIQRIN